jgi:UDP-2,3-diacylglucosamine hydrolase
VGEQLFIADLHLSAGHPGALARFLDFLAGRAATAETLYILGDLFDAWIGDDDDSQVAERVRRGLAGLTAGGVALRLQHGNRDFLLGERFCAATGAALLPEATVVTVAGEPTLLMHGDLLCTDDTDYQRARAMLRNPAFVADFLTKPLAERATLAAEYRRRSGEATSLKADEIMDVNADTVARYLREHGARRLIHGHTHRQAIHALGLEGIEATRWVLGEWHEDRGSLLSDSGSGLHFETV